MSFTQKKPPQSETNIPNNKPVGENTESLSNVDKATSGWLTWGAWILAIGLVLVAIYLGLPGRQRPVTDPVSAAPPDLVEESELPVQGDQQEVILPTFEPFRQVNNIRREPNLHTIIPNRPRAEVIQYEVDFGDAVFGIAEKFGITPETVLWANYELLNDNPDLLEPGMELNIPPVNGVYYEWQEGDTIEGVASKFEADADDILGFSGNDFDLTNPEVEPNTMVMIPGGHREFRQWLIPTIARGNAGVNTTALGPGACSGSYEGAYGSGAFIWPTGNHYLSGNDYWSGHLGIDLAAGFGATVYAADHGVVVFSGWAVRGYGNSVMIDHGNGYQSLYAHLSSVSVPCGASVSAGSVIGSSGSTGNSTGSHLHFEVRLNGGFVNPWYVLPAP